MSIYAHLIIDVRHHIAKCNTVEWLQLNACLLGLDAPSIQRPASFVGISTRCSSHLLFGLLLISASKSVSLGLDSLLSPLPGSLGLRTLGIHLLLQDPLTLLLSLGFVNLLDVSLV